MKKWFLWAVMVSIGASLAVAQDSPTATAYAWDQGNLALAYPAAWEAPIPVEENGREVLHLAQAMADSPDIRPAGIPIITLTVIPDGVLDSDVTPLLQTELEALTIQPGDPTTAALLGYDAVQMTGVSSDGLLFGMGRAAQLPDGRVVLMTGRALAAQQEVFTQTYQQVALSLVQGVFSTPSLTTFGVLWHTERMLLDSKPFLDLVGLVYGPHDRLYTVDKTQGVVIFDAHSGQVAVTFPNDQLTSPSAIAVDADGTVYVADTGCRCIQTLGADGQWRNPSGGFGEDAPFALAYSAGGDATGVYATDQTLSGYFVRLFTGQTDPQSISLGTSLATQPLLAVDRTGRVLALTSDGQVFALADNAATPLFNIGRSWGKVNTFAVDLNNNLVLATQNQGLVVVNSGGQEVNRLGRIVPIFPQPGEVVSPDGVAVGPDGTIYCADSDGSFGAVTAFSASAVPSSNGSTELTLDTPVQGTLNELAPEQSWTYAGTAGERLMIFASDLSHAGALDVQLTLIAPDGHTVAFDDDQAGYDLFSAQDAEISDTLAASGDYTVKVERVSGSGGYSLAISGWRSFDLSADGVTRLDGQLLDAIPTQRWTFEAQAGQVLTFTMQAADGTTLDTVLRLYGPDGQKLTEDDDADDPALGKNSQLVQVRLPASGTYTLEASRFEGEGQYSLVIVETS